MTDANLITRNRRLPMTDMSMIAALFGGIQQGLSAAQAVLSMKTSAEVGVKIAEVVDRLHATQQQITALLERHAALVQKNGVLEKKLGRISQFKNQKKRYLLTDLGPDAYAYTLDPAHQGVQPLHSACAHCYQQGEIQILQFDRYESQFKVLSCQACKAEIKFPHGITADLVTTRRRTGSITDGY